MPESVVLITGVSRYLGARLAAVLSDEPGIGRLIGVDTVPPRPQDEARFGRCEFVRADIANPHIAKVLTQARVDTVLHTATRSRLGPQATVDQHVTGTMQLLAGAQTSDTVRRVVLASTTAVYGSSSRDPGVFTESMQPATPTSDVWAREAVEIETHTRAFARRRPDIEVSILRLASIMGPTVDSALTRLLALPVVTTAFGFDPRLQLVHESDAVEVLRRATLDSHPGVCNVAGDGVVPLSQALRRAGRMHVPVPKPAFGLVRGVVRTVTEGGRAADLLAEQGSYLEFGRVVDTTVLREQFGYTPRWSTADALTSFFDERVPLPRPALAAVVAGQHLLADHLPALAGR